MGFHFIKPVQDGKICPQTFRYLETKLKLAISGLGGLKAPDGAFRR